MVFIENLQDFFEDLGDFINDNKTLVSVLLILGILILIWLLRRLNAIVFKRIQRKQPGLHVLFFERVISACIFIVGIIVIFSVFGGVDSVWKSMLGGTAIISAVLAFAAQDVIKDILAGMMISVYKPFEVGNRIELEDGTAGIIKDITMRHVVIQGIDTQMWVIPNSRLNSMKIRNFSYHAVHKGAQFQFNIAYGSDVEKAMSLIRQAVIDSEYTIPGKLTDKGREYSHVYFTAFDDSSLRLVTTVYFEPKTPSEVVISDINMRVDNAFREHGIEIPFQYINVINKSDVSEAEEKVSK